MKQSIYKYQLEVTDKQNIELPKGAEILTVQTHYGIVCIWALVDKEAEKEYRSFEIFGTGHNIPVDMGVERKYIGTFQLNDGALVFHLFERIN